ncbi:MAG: hypothetical protein ACRCX2_10540 [Paraclostridium sp.]
MIEYTTEGLNALINLMDRKLNKDGFNNNVSLYKSIVSGIPTTNGITHELFPSLQDDTRPDIGDLNQYIDYWVSTFETAVWNYSQPAFELYPNQYGHENDEGLIEYYSYVSRYILSKFNYRSCNFKKAFNTFIRDWYEFGMGVIYIDEITEGDHTQEVFISIPPENVAIEYGRTHNIERIIISQAEEKKAEAKGIKGYKGFFSASIYDTFLNEDIYDVDNIYNIYEYNPSTKAWHSALYIHKMSTDKLHMVYENKKHHTQPIYISMSGLRSGNKIGFGRGLQGLKLLTEINNIQQSLKEAASRSLEPTIICPVGQLDVHKQDLLVGNSLSDLIGVKILQRSQGSVAGDMPIQELPGHPRPELALNLLALYQARLLDMFSPNKMILAKGTSGMSVPETQIRDAYDRTSITQQTALIVDDVLIPLIRYITHKYQNEVKHSIEHDQNIKLIVQSLKGIDLSDFNVRVRNTTGEQQTDQRMADLQNYIALVKQAAQLQQMGIDGTQILAEAKRLFNMEGSTPEGENRILSELTSLIAQQGSDTLTSKSEV